MHEKRKEKNKTSSGTALVTYGIMHVRLHTALWLRCRFVSSR